MDQHEPRPKLLLHACCGVCSSYMPELLAPDYDVTLYYENSNIWPSEEFRRRSDAARSMAESFNIPFIEVPQDHPSWFRDVRGHASDNENGERCRICMAHRMRNVFEYARDHGFDIVTTTMIMSRNKPIAMVNEIGHALSHEFGIPYLDTNFKKKGGEDASHARSKQAGIYRQNYCGCVYSFVKRNNPAES
jgi:predicted adenine nucleotide alpha hydrolase (AANH) superfamily ATPase